eukprot:CAMPEP_0183369954 /NCGR_PEP_ID=MMETSP0164_2-20130417/101059_1 /TAXON_ID=221442 /ORGANISM="Coccolithus pelagicus ssp braarudi, Strain PLY182g" /LENGTH=84 /DNA_ID=CAMNT_0025546273 /DNA_START=64 /DNA_END=315 /DNA_ORIENTATION=+
MFVVAALTSTALVSEVTQVCGTLLLLRVAQQATRAADVQSTVVVLLAGLENLGAVRGLGILFSMQVLAQIVPLFSALTLTLAAA